MACYDKYRTSSMRRNNGLDVGEVVSKHESLPKDTQVIVRIEEGLKLKAQEYAKAHGMTLSELVRQILIEASEGQEEGDVAVDETYEVRDADQVTKEAEQRVMAKLKERVRLKKDQAARDQERMKGYLE
jgi:antitoxin component of RelBE/YafQ-DinJ toxin-antitoxin module